MGARWCRYMEAAQAEDLPEKTPKKKKTPAAVGPISQPATKPLPTVQQQSGMAHAFQEPPPPPAPQLYGLAPAAQEPPPPAAPQVGLAPTFPQSPPSRPFQTF